MEFKELYFMKQKYLKVINEVKKNKDNNAKNALKTVDENQEIVKEVSKETQEKINLRDLINLL
jgi:hypothetical protein